MTKPITIRETVPRPWVKPYPPTVPDPKYEPGEALCLHPFEAESFISFTTPIGQITGVVLSLLFQFRKWGFVRYKVDESIFVSPVFKQYYDLTVTQKEQLQATIKAALASIAQAIADFELVLHDLRKYREYMDYFRKIERGKRLIKAGKIEEGEKELTEGNQTLKSIFIDQVDVHTGEGVALKLIAPKWPTIIVDFMRLRDEDTDPKKIAEKYGVSEAEGVVLATKNKLFVEWRDRMFKPTVVERYKRLKSLAEARKKSIEEYKNMVRPTIARYKMIVDSLENPGLRGAIKTSILMPHAHALSADWVTIWAWKPFAPIEKYKITRESFDLIPALKAGFNGREIEELKKAKRIGPDGKVFGLPLEPSIDRVVRFYWKVLQEHYKIKLTVVDLFDARNMLVQQFRHSISALTAVEPWVWSPYFVFVSIPIQRAVLRLPNGVELSDVEITPTTASYSQNLIIIRCLELIARQKELENYIKQMLGEYGVEPENLELLEIEEIVKREFPEIYMSEEEIRAKEKEEKRLERLEGVVSFEIKKWELFRKVRKTFGKIFKEFGFPVQVIRAVGPYEFMLDQRLKKIIQVAPGTEYGRIVDFLKTKFGVPGFETKW